MSDPKEFLERWSRRKLQSEAPSAAPVEKVALPTAGKPAADPAAAVKSAPPAEFDLTKLPSIESIAAGTDVRVFLQRGVPAALTRAALRRAWAADPAIRDFIGLSENSWDFTAPDSLPGFGPLEPDEIRRVAAQLFGEPGEATVSGDSLLSRNSLVQSPSTLPETGTVRPHEMRTAALEKRRSVRLGEVQDEKHSDKNADVMNKAGQPDVDGATQHQEKDTEDELQSLRPRHGGALPE